MAEGRLVISTGASRCHARDGNGARCTLAEEHSVTTTAAGKTVRWHETKHSIWSVPILATTD